MVGLGNPLHLVLIAVVVLMVFGAKRLPELGRSLGRGMREFKESVSGEERPSELDTGSDEAPSRPANVESSTPKPERSSVGAPAEEPRPAAEQQASPAPVGPAAPPAAQ